MEECTVLRSDGGCVRNVYSSSSDDSSAGVAAVAAALAAVAALEHSKGNGGGLGRGCVWRHRSLSSSDNSVVENIVVGSVGRRRRWGKELRCDAGGGGGQGE